MDVKDLMQQRKDAIRSIIYSDEYIPMKLKEMAYLLNVPVGEREELRAVMDALIEEGSVELTAKGKYVKPQKRNLIGIFTANKKGFGFVKVEDSEEEIFVPASYVNGAFNADKVMVKVSKNAINDYRAEGMVTKILERGTKEIVGTFTKGRGGFGFVVADDPHIPVDIYIPAGKTKAAADYDKVSAKIIDYGNEDRKPTGIITDIIGNIDDPMTDVTSIVRAFGINEEFPKSVISEAMKIEPVDGYHMQGRKDLRGLLTVTIDGEDAKDLDDAISIHRDGEGYVLGVHIADVSHYVREGSALDTEALNRGTSVYLCDRVIPMLPKALSNGICSLNAGEDRLSLSCIMHFDKEGNITDHQIAESVICVDKRMSYTGVAAILDGKDHPEADRADICSMCGIMEELALKLKDKRRKRGAIDFDFPEAKITVDEKGYPEAIVPYERNVATDIIEDFMLVCNETVAQEYFWMEIPFIYRVHESPDIERIRKLAIFINNFGKHIKISSDSFHPKEIQKLLQSVAGTNEEALISRIALRSMQQARYNCINLGHFGLSTQYYTHFTSPIRRYPDLIIHRIIKENLHGGLNNRRIDHYDAILPEVALKSSELERRAQNAEREVVKLKKIEYMKSFIGECYSAIISGVTSFGFFVELENTVEGLCSINDLLDDSYIFKEKEYSLVGQNSGKIYTLGQRVEVLLIRVDKFNRTIDFIPEDIYSCYFRNDWVSDETVSKIMSLY